MKESPAVYLTPRGGGRYFNYTLYIAVLSLMATTCLAAPNIPPPPGGLKLGPEEQAMLEALVDEAIAQEELARTRRQEDNKANKRFSSGADHHHEEYGPPPTPHDYKSKAFSLWSFKKAILSALLQSIKAITGGVIALSGQLVKVKGHLVAAKGKLLETKGDAITEFGKHIATKALLTPMHSSSSYDHSSPGSGSDSSYSPPSSHGGPYPAAAPPSSYGPPSSSGSGHSSHHPSSNYGPPSHDSYTEYHGPPPSSNYLPPTAVFHSAPESWLMAAGNYAEPPSSHSGGHHVHHEHSHHPIQKKEAY